MTTINLDDLPVPNMTPEGLGPWSPSKLKCLQKCSFQFYLKYVMKYKPEEVPPVSEVTEIGKAAHAILEHVLKGSDIGIAYKVVKAEYEQKLPPETWADKVETLELSISNFSERIEAFDKKHTIVRKMMEKRIGLTRDWKPTGFFSGDVYWRGVIDFAIQAKDKVVLIIDHKTGAPAVLGTRPFQFQLDTYKVFYHYGIEPIPGARAGIHFIRDGEVKLDDFVETNKIEDSIRPRMDFYVNGAIDAVKDTGYFKHKRSNQCEWCDFNIECKAKKLLPIEMATKKFFEIKPVEVDNGNQDGTESIPGGEAV